jgi:hypothetical protein
MTWSIIGPEFYLINLQLNPLTGTLEWRNIDNDDVGEHTFTIQVKDSGGSKDTLEVNLTIENTNDPPVFAHIMDHTIFEDGHLSYSIRVTDPDQAVDPEEVLTWVVEPPLFDILPEGTFTFVPSREHLGDHNVTITVTDRLGASYQQTFSILVKPVNHPPLIRAIPDQVAYEDEPWSIEINVSDVDPGDFVELVARVAPFTVPSSGGLVQWTPQERHGGEHLVTLEASDPGGAKSTLAFNLTVITRNDPPEVSIQVPEEGAVYEYGEELLLSAQVSDEEGDDLAVVWKWRFNNSIDQQWTRINTGTTAFWPKPPDGNILLRVEASDGSNTTVEEVVFTVGSPPGEDEGGIPMAFLALALVGFLAVLLILRAKGGFGSLGTPPPVDGEVAIDDGEEASTPEEDSWEPY